MVKLNEFIHHIDLEHIIFLYLDYEENIQLLPLLYNIDKTHIIWLENSLLNLMNKDIDFYYTNNDPLCKLCNYCSTKLDSNYYIIYEISHYNNLILNLCKNCFQNVDVFDLFEIDNGFEDVFNTCIICNKNTINYKNVYNEKLNVIYNICDDCCNSVTFNSFIKKNYIFVENNNYIQLYDNFHCILKNEKISLLKIPKNASKYISYYNTKKYIEYCRYLFDEYNEYISSNFSFREWLPLNIPKDNINMYLINIYTGLIGKLMIYGNFKTNGFVNDDKAMKTVFSTDSDIVYDLQFEYNIIL